MYIDVDVDVDLDIDVGMHTETFRNCARVLVPNYLPKTWQSRQIFWRCLEDPGMITKPKNHSWHTKDCANDSKNWSSLISGTCHLTLAFPVFFPECKFILPEKFFGEKNHHRRDFSLKTRCSWRLFERDPGGSGLGDGGAVSDQVSLLSRRVHLRTHQYTPVEKRKIIFQAEHHSSSYIVNLSGCNETRSGLIVTTQFLALILRRQ